METGDYVSDISKFQSGTGLSPKVSFYAGVLRILRTIDFYRENRGHYWVRG